MKTLTLSLALLSMSIGSAHASEQELMNRTGFEGRFTRAEIQEDFLRARADGTLPDTSEAAAMHSPAFAGSAVPLPQLTREQVTAEYLQARAEGSLVDTSEVGSMHAPRLAGTRIQRPEVYAEGWATAGVGENE